MAILHRASILAYRMRFSRTFAIGTRFALALFGVTAALLADPGLASAETIPGPPLAGSEAGAFCPLPASAGGSAASFAAGVAIVAIAARRRDLRS
jgi:hypothetical protein